MKYQHIRHIYKNPFFVNFKKHYCPVCDKALNKIKVSKIVNSNSPEAEKFDFHTLDSYMIGNVKFIWTEFKCDACEKNYTIEEMKQIEKERKAKSKRHLKD